MRRHATWNRPRSATFVFRFAIRKLAISVQASYAVAYATGSWLGFPGSFFAVHCATATKGSACWLGFWSRSRELKSNSGVFLKLLAFANFAFFAAPKLLHSPTPSVQVSSPSRTAEWTLFCLVEVLRPSRTADFLPHLCSTSTTNFDSPSLQAIGGLVASQTRR